MDWNNPLIFIIGLGTLITAIITLIKIGEWKGKREYFERTTGSAITGINRAIIEIQKDIKKILRWMDKPAFEGTSPYALTDFGKELAQDIDSKSWARSKATELRPSVEGMEAYDIQSFCFDYVKGDKFQPSPDFSKKLKKCAYEHGTTMDKIHDVLAIELRDALLRILPD